MKVKVEAYCPPMPIYKINNRLRRTAAEPMRVTLIWPDGMQKVISNVTIPPTDVNRLSLGHWVVEACEAHGEQDGLAIHFWLPAEDVLLDLNALFHTGHIYMVAQQMTASVYLNIESEHLGGTGSVIFPNCKTDVMAAQPTAEALIATGELDIY